MGVFLKLKWRLIADGAELTPFRQAGKQMLCLRLLAKRLPSVIDVDLLSIQTNRFAV